MNKSNAIKFACFLKGWTFLEGDRSELKIKSNKVLPLEYLQHMKGHIFCPECSAPLFRSPEDKDVAKDGRKAFFAHARGVQTDCGLRVKQASGKQYENEEEAAKAVENDELVLVHAFMHEGPSLPQPDGQLVYDREPNEDAKGPLTIAPIGRHNGEEFKLPSRITTIRGLCRNFDNNLNKYFLLPGQRSALTLQEQLISVSDVMGTDDVPRIYVGRITRSKGNGPNLWNIRQTFLKFTNDSEFKDFCLKATNKISDEHGMVDDSKGRIALAYGKVVVSGVGLCIADLGWGEVALLPKKYEHLLDL